MIDMKRFALITALMLIALMVPTSIYALQSSNVNVIQIPREIALQYIIASPTFSFDGMSATLKEVKVVILKSIPAQYIYTFEFDCLHGGYGDRSGQTLSQVITKHTAVVSVIDGKVTNAVLDESWDEITQKPINQTSSDIERVAITWLYNSPTFKFDGISDSIKVIEIWQAMTFAAPSFWQVTIEFDSKHAGYGDRTDQVMAEVITHHSIRIHVTEGKITMAIIDDKWDELNQNMLPSTHTPEEAQQIALEWLYGCPTFKFDGIYDTVKLQWIDTLRMPNTYEVNIGFVCGYPGYGNRTGNVMMGHSQQHNITITVREGEVTRAIIDEKWDEMSQKMINSEVNQFITPESARDIVLAYLIKTYELNYELSENWTVEEMKPQEILGFTSYKYNSGQWSILVEYAVVLNPTYTVTVEYAGDEAFAWRGTVDQSRVIQEEKTNLSRPSTIPQQIYGPEEALNICIKYILFSHPEIQVKVPDTWKIRNLVPEGIVGAIKLEYSTAEWKATVSGPVVWKPTYTVEVKYSGEKAFTWSGILPQGDVVQEIIFIK
jgi:hypothetical protein